MGILLSWSFYTSEILYRTGSAWQLCDCIWNCISSHVGSCKFPSGECGAKHKSQVLLWPLGKIEISWGCVSVCMCVLSAYRHGKLPNHKIVQQITHKKRNIITLKYCTNNYISILIKSHNLKCRLVITTGRNTQTWIWCKKNGSYKYSQPLNSLSCVHVGSALLGLYSVLLWGVQNCDNIRMQMWYSGIQRREGAWTQIMK